MDRDGIEHITVATDVILDERRATLRELIPEAFTEGMLDIEKLRTALGEDVASGPERYTFSWAGKRDAIQLLQVPSRATLVPDPSESINFSDTGHVFIEGDNLEVLKLLRKSYHGQVKLIYIDPPYNTGNDFVYPDNFTDPLSAYLQLTGQQDGNGNHLTSNAETSGRYHSAWLSMMYPRLFIARQLLREDGVIFVSIDDHEVHNLRMLMNEIFGEENFIAQFIWKSRQFPDSRSITHVSTDHEYIIAYGRSADLSFRGIARDETKFSNPDKDPDGPWMSRSLLGLATAEQRPNLHFPITDPATGKQYYPPQSTGWRYSSERMQKLIMKNRIIFPSSPDGRPREKKFRVDIQHDFVSFPTIIDDVYTSQGTAEIRELFGYQAFDFPKPSALIRRIVEQASHDEDIVLDFFAGSGTTAHAVYACNRVDGGNRQCICIQLPEKTSDKTFTTIAELSKERIHRIIAKMQQESSGILDLDERETPEDLGFRVFKLAESNFRQWVGETALEPEEYIDRMALFLDPLLDGWTVEKVIWEVAVKEGYALTARIASLPDIATNAVYRVTDEDKGQAFRICLDADLRQETIDALALTVNDLIICRDVALTDDLAANLALQCRLKSL